MGAGGQAGAKQISGEWGRTLMARLIKNVVRGVVRSVGYDLVRRRKARECRPSRPDVSNNDMAIMMRVRPFTMTSDERILALIDAVRYLVRYGIPGAIVECGVWKGGSSMAAALTLLESRDLTRELYLYDTFEGMTAPTSADRSYDGVLAEDQLREAARGTGVWCQAGLDEVRGNLASTTYPLEKMHFVRGPVEETIPRVLPELIGLLRLDTDWYESTRHELTHLFPRLVTGGVLIIDDYGHWEGARRATDEYFASLGCRIFFHRLDYTGRIAVKE